MTRNSDDSRVWIAYWNRLRFSLKTNGLLSLCIKVTSDTHLGSCDVSGLVFPRNPLLRSELAPSCPAIKSNSVVDDGHNGLILIRSSYARITGLVAGWAHNEPGTTTACPSNNPWGIECCFVSGSLRFQVIPFANFLRFINFCFALLGDHAVQGSQFRGKSTPEIRLVGLTVP